MDGSATFTIVMSKTIMSIPVHSTTRAVQRERSCITVFLSRMRPSGAFHYFGLGPERKLIARDRSGRAGPRNVHEQEPPGSTAARERPRGIFAESRRDRSWSV